jgi:hypothetical protein
MDNLLAVVIGVVCGALASIPFGLLILMLVAGKGQREKTVRAQEAAAPAYRLIADLCSVR